MDTQAIESMVDQMMTVIFLLCGIYCVVLFFLKGNENIMKKSKFLYPTGCAPEKCRSLPEYLNQLMPKVLLLGIGLVVFGAAGLVFRSGTLAALLLLILPLALLFWFVAAQKKLAAQYWKSSGPRR
ncbi:MAG: hypothetical protein Q4C54_06995 [Clostridia bacterium]|nr:hypothetical protein [Clostridia bacterium]